MAIGYEEKIEVEKQCAFVDLVFCASSESSVLPVAKPNSAKAFMLVVTRVFAMLTQQLVRLYFLFITEVCIVFSFEYTTKNIRPHQVRPIRAECR